MTIGSEKASVQNPFCRYAEEAGWMYLSIDDALDLRRGIESPVLDTVLIEQLQKLNPETVDHLRAEQLTAPGGPSLSLVVLSGNAGDGKSLKGTIRTFSLVGAARFRFYSDER